MTFANIESLTRIRSVQLDTSASQISSEALVLSNQFKILKFIFRSGMNVNKIQREKF